MKQLTYMITVAMLLTPAAAMSFDDEFLFPTDSRIKILPYDESDVYTITTKYGYQTHLVFSPNEEIHTISIGDRSLWQIIPARNRLFIRPMDENVMTNMTILTSKRSYQFDLESVGDDSKNTSIMYVAKFVYPEDMPVEDMEVELSPYDEELPDVLPEPPPITSPAPADPMVQPAVSESNVMPNYPRASTHTTTTPVEQIGSVTGTENYRYTYSGPDELAPQKVFDNGKSTFFKYPAMNQPLPNAYIITNDGSEKPVAHYVYGGYMIVDDTAAEWLLKSSAGDIMVYNEMLNPNSN